MQTPTSPSENLFLHDYFRSSAAYRVRIALRLKSLDYRHCGVHLVRDGGEQFAPDYRALNPQCLVPTLRSGTLVLTQSLAIIEYLDERHPKRPLLPFDIELRARVRQIALLIACDIHPINNLRVLTHLGHLHGASDPDRSEWVRHWIEEGFLALEQLLELDPSQRTCCVGNTPTLADCCLVPQVFNARRFGVDMARFPHIERIDAACNALPAFEQAHPMRQPDAA